MSKIVNQYLKCYTLDYEDTTNEKKLSYINLTVGIDSIVELEEDVTRIERQGICYDICEPINKLVNLLGLEHTN